MVKHNYETNVRGVSAMREELGIAVCGLACCLCSENDHCGGCGSGACPDRATCENIQCASARGLTHCYQCDLDCRKGLLSKGKPYAFTLFVRRYGLEHLLACLKRNEERGIVYHRQGIWGDYDDFNNPEKLLHFIETGRR